MTLDPWSYWVFIAILLLSGEILSAGFYLFFLSLGGFAGAIVSATGGTFFSSAATAVSVAIFGLLVLRKPVQRRFQTQAQVQNDLGQELVLSEPIAAGATARIQYQGTSWTAQNSDAQNLNTGDRVSIVATDGNTLIIRKLNSI